MNKQNRQLVGIALIVIGVIFLLDRLGILSFSLLFNGWWTLFLIVPAVLNIRRYGFQTGNTVLLLLGSFFLLDAQGVNLRGYLLPGIFIAIGLVVLFRKR